MIQFYLVFVILAIFNNQSSQWNYSKFSIINNQKLFNRILRFQNKKFKILINVYISA